MDGTMQAIATPGETSGGSASIDPPFWIIKRFFRDCDGVRPFFRHYSRSAAEREAERLQSVHGGIMLVLKSVVLIGNGESAPRAPVARRDRASAAPARDLLERTSVAIDRLLALLDDAPELLSHPDLQEFVRLRQEIAVRLTAAGQSGS